MKCRKAEALHTKIFESQVSIYSSKSLMIRNGSLAMFRRIIPLSFLPLCHGNKTTRRTAYTLMFTNHAFKRFALASSSLRFFKGGGAASHHDLILIKT